LHESKLHVKNDSRQLVFVVCLCASQYKTLYHMRQSFVLHGLPALANFLP
jgi:hypothetical protein